MAGWSHPIAAGEGDEQGLTVAAVNGPSATVVSGDPGLLWKLLEVVEAEGGRARMLPVDYASHGPQVDELREEILRLLNQVSPRKARIPMVSALTGEYLTGMELNAQYWFDSLRGRVEFSRAVAVLGRDGYGVFIESSAHPVLTAPVSAILEGLGAEPVVTGTLRRGDGGGQRVLASMAEVFVRGVNVDWTSVLTPGHRIDLPTYAFTPQRYWPNTGVVGADVTSAGLGSVGHPLLGARVEMADGEGMVVTGRLSARSAPWLAEYDVAGVPLVPGTALAELAIVAGHQAGCPRIEKLTLTTPLVLSENPTQIQIVLGNADDQGRRTVQIYARSEGASDEAAAWTWHAGGVLAQALPAPTGATQDLLVWPPPEATPIDLTHLEETLSTAGHRYGPSFRGLEAAWIQNGDLLAEVALPDVSQGSGFGVHPALLDAAVQALALAPDLTAAQDQTQVPYSWTGLSVYAPGAGRLRVRLRRTDDGWSLSAADATGAPVLAIDELVLRGVSPAQLRIAGNTLRDALFAVTWAPVPDPASAVTGPWAVLGEDHLGLVEGLAGMGVTAAVHADLAGLAASVAAGEAVPQFVLAAPRTTAMDADGTLARAGGIRGVGADGMGAHGGDGGTNGEGAVGRSESLVTQWAEMDALASSRLVLITRGAVSTGSGQSAADPAGAELWGAIRSAQRQHPGRVTLADLSAGDAAVNDRLSMLAASLTSDEPELALRGDAVLGRRITRPAPGAAGPKPSAPGTLLVTGEAGTATEVAVRHLARTGRAVAVVLALAGGPASARTAALTAELVGLEVPVWSVEPTGLLGPVNQDPVNQDPAQPGPAASRGLTRLLTRIGHPLTTVLHGAEATGAAKATALSGATRSIAFSVTDPTPGAHANPTADAVHRLTQGVTDVHSFLILTDLATTLGASGRETSVAAANLESLVAQRRADGLPATLVAWGPLTADGDVALTEVGGLTAPITGLVGALSEDDAAALLDLILERDDAQLVAARLTLARLRQTTGSASIAPPIWRALAGPPASAGVTQEERSEVTAALKARLAELSPADAERTLLTMVRGHVAAVLGESSPESIDPRRAFSELGFDSMIAVELRNRLNTATGLKLPATAVFDYPSTTALTSYLLENLGPDGDSTAEAEEARLRRILATVALSRFRDAGILDDLLRLADPEREAGNGPAAGNDHRAEDIDELDAESLIALAMGADEAPEGADH